MKYEYVNVKNKTHLMTSSFEYREIIDEYAKNGYRFVCFVPTTIKEFGEIINANLRMYKNDRLTMYK